MNAHDAPQNWPFCAGEMAQHIRMFDWDNHPLGKVASWSPSLKASIGLILTQSFPACVCIGEHFTLVYNDAYAQLLGENHPFALGMNIQDVFRAAIFTKSLNRAKDGETFCLKNQFYPFMYISKDGEEIWFDAHFAPIYDESGAVIALSILYTENHHEMDAAALRENELRTHNLFNAAPGFTAILNGENAVFEYVNDAFYALVGSRKLIGNPLKEALPELEEQGFLKLVEDVYRKKQTEHGRQVPVRFFDKKTGLYRKRYVDFICQPILDRSHQVIGVFIDGFDVTEQKEAVDFSQESELRYRTLFNSIDQGFCVIEMIFDDNQQPVDYTFIEINNQFETQTGMKDALGKRMREFSPNHEQFWFDTYGRIALSKQPERFEHEARSLNFTYEVYAFPVGDQTPAHVGVMFRNITERKEAEHILENKGKKHNYLLRFNDAIQHEEESADVYSAALHILCEEIKADKAFFSIIFKNEIVISSHEYPHASSVGFAHAFGVPPLTATERKRMRPLCVNDAATTDAISTQKKQIYNSLGVKSFLCVPVRIDKDTMQFLTLVSHSPKEWSETEIDIACETCERTLNVVKRIQMDEALAESEQALRTLTESIPQLVWRSSSKGKCVWASQQWLDFTGQTTEEALNFGWLGCIHPDDITATMESWENAQEAEELYVEHRIKNGGDGQYYWFHTRARPIKQAFNNQSGWVGTSTEVQHLKELHDRQRVMVAELQHRTRNLIAVIKSIVAQTMAATGPTAAFQEELNHRLGLLSRVQGLLSQSGEEPIMLDTLITMELDALGVDKHAAQRITVKGAKVKLRDSAVQTLALALHELATNARKYGALSSETGNLAIEWAIKTNDKEQDVLALQWIETGINAQPAKEDTQRTGYGRELIEKALPYTLGAKTALIMNEQGVQCYIDLPIDKNIKQQSTAL